MGVRLIAREVIRMQIEDLKMMILYQDVDWATATVQRTEEIEVGKKRGLQRIEQLKKEGLQGLERVHKNEVQGLDAAMQMVEEKGLRR